MESLRTVCIEVEFGYHPISMSTRSRRRGTLIEHRNKVEDWGGSRHVFLSSSASVYAKY